MKSIMEQKQFQLALQKLVPRKKIGDDDDDDDVGDKNINIATAI